MLEVDGIDKIFPADVIKRAKEYLDAIPGGTGAYSDSQGAPILREQIAKVSSTQQLMHAQCMMTFTCLLCKSTRMSCLCPAE